MVRSGLGGVLESERLNAALAWLLVSFLVVVVIESLAGGDLLWALFAGSVAALALVPTASSRRPTVMLPWEVLALSALPILGRAFATVALTGQLSTYLAVAAIALIVAVELHVFTPVQMTHGFAVLFVVIATMATAGVWAVVQWLSDVYLGTRFIQSEELLMWNFVYATAAGLLAGAIFVLYFQRRGAAQLGIPEGAGGVR